MTYESLRKQYPVFSYDSFALSQKDRVVYLRFDFSCGEHHFAPVWEIPAGKCDLQDPALNRLAFSLGLTEAISYWKATCSPTVEVKAGALNRYQQEWFENLFWNGLSEFRYRNGIQTEKKNFVKIISLGQELPKVKNPSSLSGVLIPVGGGKDSAVSLELLKDGKEENLCFIINPRGASKSCAEAAGYKDRIVSPIRGLDKHLLELNKEGYLNGHTPFSAMTAFASCLCALLYGKKYVALSNESSANESTVEGTDINHQYSKTFDFEKGFAEYMEREIPCGVTYFSLLRPYSEFQIARFFAGNPKYFPIFKSCNVGSKQDIWCTSCPKCLFVYLMLSAFLSQETLVSIFGKNLLEDASLQETFEQLIGLLPEKPFECVGSRAEARASACLAIEKNKNLPLLLQRFKDAGLYEKYRVSAHDFDRYFDENHLVPPLYHNTFEKMMNV